MGYGLRRYEAIQRLWWLIFFVLCVFVANYSHSFSQTPRTPAQMKDLRTKDFWYGLHGIRMAPPVPEVVKDKLDHGDSGQKLDARKPPATERRVPITPPPPGPSEDAQKDVLLLSKALVYLIRLGVIFLQLKLIWLVVQYAGKYLLQWIMWDSMKNPGPLKPELARTNPEALFPRAVLLDKFRKIPLHFLLHAFLRLRLMLSGFQKNVSSEELFEKERRIIETDWQILYGSWGPFKLLFWVLPVLGLAQTGWLLVIQFHVASASQKEILDTIQSMPNLLLPLIQAAGVAIFFKLATSVLRRVEELYLSNLDAFFYDRLLSRLPLQSNDTVLILETLQGQFKDLQAAIRRLEKLIQPERHIEKKP